MTGIGSDCAGRGVRQADALTGSDTEARTAPQQSLYFIFSFSPAGLFSLCPAVPVSAAVCLPAGDHRRHPGLHHLPGGKEVSHLAGMSCDQHLSQLTEQFPTLPTEAHISFHDVSFHSFPFAVYLNSFLSPIETHLTLLSAVKLSSCVHSVPFPNVTHFPIVFFPFLPLVLPFLLPGNLQLPVCRLYLQKCHFLIHFYTCSVLQRPVNWRKK